MARTIKSLLQDLDTYRRGTPPYIKANNELKARDKLRRERKEVKRTYKPRDRVNYKKFYGMNKDNILDLLGCTNVQVWQYHRNGTLERMLRLAGGGKRRKLKQLGCK